MRVLYVTANSHLRSTTSSLNAIIRQLTPRGLEPVMLFREPGPWQKTLESEGVPCYFDPLNVPGKDRPIASIRDIWRLARLVRTEKIDLIHCNEHEHYPLIRRVARFSGRPAVVTLHWLLDGFGPWAFRPPFAPAAIQFLSQGQLNISRSFIPAEVSPRAVKLLMSGLALDEFLSRGGSGEELRRAWGVGPNTVVLGTASAIKPRKHLEDFIRLVARLRRRGLDVVGVIAGGGIYTDKEYQAMLYGVIAEEQLGDYCKFIGNLDPVTPFFRAIDIGINTAEMEILSMSLCEGQICGKPTLAYAVGGNPEALPDAWCAVPFGELDELEDKAARLVEEPDFRHDLGRRAAAFVRKHFDAPVLADRQAAIYEEIVGRGCLSGSAKPREAACTS